MIRLYILQPLRGKSAVPPADLKIFFILRLFTVKIADRTILNDNDISHIMLIMLIIYLQRCIICPQ
jgi:hypothetical protein